MSNVARSIAPHSGLGVDEGGLSSTSAETVQRTLAIAIADDHPMVRYGLAQVLDTQHDLEVVLSVSDGPSLLEALQRTRVDVCLIDVSMPLLDGIETLRRIRTAGNSVPVLMCSMFSEKMYAPQCIREGANGFVAKSASSEDLIEAVRSVADGHVYLSNEVLRSMMGRSSTPQLAHERLSSREFEVFLRIAEGRTNTEITEELHLDTRTVSTYRRRVLDKLGLQRDRDLIDYAIRHNIVK